MKLVLCYVYDLFCSFCIISNSKWHWNEATLFKNRLTSFAFRALLLEWNRSKGIFCYWLFSSFTGYFARPSQSTAQLSSLLLMPACVWVANAMKSYRTLNQVQYPHNSHVIGLRLWLHWLEDAGCFSNALSTYSNVRVAHEQGEERKQGNKSDSVNVRQSLEILMMTICNE